MKKSVLLASLMLMATHGFSAVPTYDNPINYYNGNAKIAYPQKLKPLNFNGIFVNEDYFLKMRVGLTKHQVQSLFGTPQHSYGYLKGLFGSRQWLYVFNVVQGDHSMTCPYIVSFDRNNLVERAFFGDSKCF
jgi:outer membrane protein assembly factor BamE (lipoprotein component of BamABCDE complex)